MLKTSLIITGDSSVAKKEVDELNQKVAALAAGARAAASPVQQLDQVQNGTATAARQAATAQQGLADAIAQSAAKSKTLGAANDQAAASSAAAAAGARAQADAARGVEAAIGAMAEQIGSSTTSAQAEFDALNRKIDALAVNARTATGPVQQLEQAEKAAAAAAREVAAAHESSGDAAAKSIAQSGNLAAANDQVAASSAAAAEGAKVQAAASEGVQSAIGAMIAQVAGGASVFDAMATHGDAFAAALAEIAGASAGTKAGIEGIGSSGQDAGVDLGGLGDTVVDTAGKVEGMGGKLGSVAAILGGPWGAAIGIGINLLGGFVAGLIQGAQESDNLAASSMSLADALAAQGGATDAARQAIEDYNRQSDQARQRMVIEEQLALRTATAWLQKAAGIRANTKALLDQRVAEASTPAQAIGGTVGGGGNFLGGIRIAAVQSNLQRQDDDIAARQQSRRELLIKEAKRAAAAAADPLEAINQKYDRLGEAAEKAAAKSTKAAESLAANLTRIEVARNKALADAKPQNTPAIRVPHVSTPKQITAAPTRDLAAEAAAEAQRQLGRDLDQVTARYLPATAAANDYAEALAQIDRLAKAFDGKKAGGLSPEQAERARAAAAAARDARLADLQRTPESQAADAARKSVDGVIAALGRETAARATLDPVQRAMLQHQAELAKLTGAERTEREAALEGYYRQAEATRAIDEATRAAADAQRQFRDMALDAFDAIALGGENAGKVIDRLAQRIASAAIEATVLGTGPLAALLKGGGAPVPGAAAAVPGVATGQAAADLVGKSVGKSVGDRLDGLFGKGQSGKILQNAGFGYAAASIAGGSGIAGGLGGAVGGQLASKFLSSAMGSLGGLAGPLGSIAGGLIGGVVGKLFTSVKSGSATIGSANGQSVVTGSTGDAAYKKASEGLASAVGDSVDAIVAKLGGTLGNYAVSIGKKGDKFVVDNSGRGSTSYGKANDGITAYATAEEAQAAALKNAIADGAVQGLSPKVAAAFRSSTNIDKALSEALKVQDLELTMSGITGTIDKAFRDLDIQAKERVRLARQYGFDLVAIEKKNGEDRAKLAEQLQKQQVGSLQKLIDEMTAGSLFEGTAIDKLAALETAISKARTDLANNVEGAGDTLAELLQRKAATSKDAYGTTGAYAADRTAILDEARAAVAASNARIAAAQAANSSDPALKVTNAALDENNDQNAQIISALRANNDLLTQIAAVGGGGVGVRLTSNAAY